MKLSKKDIVLRKDGNMWMCTDGTFIDLAVSTVFWGRNPHTALVNYLADKQVEES